MEEWDKTYGMVYKTLIDGGLDAIMGGHIMLPEYARAINPALKDEDMMPATLSPEIMTTLLRGKLGFNGMVVTDASHMVGMTDRMTRREMLPASINAGCDMFLFFNDPDEDFNTMLDAYKSGVIGEARMTEALTRILGLKAHLGLNKKAKEALVPAPEVLAGALGKEEYKEMHKAISRDCITLVKYKDRDVLPITPERYKRIMIVHVKGAESGMGMLMKAMGMGGGKNPAEMLKERLCEKGFDAFIYESPLDAMKKQIAAGVYRPGDRIVETQLAREMNVSQHRCGRLSWRWSPWGCWKNGRTQAILCGLWGRRRLRISIRPVPSWRNMLPNVRQTGHGGSAGGDETTPSGDGRQTGFGPVCSSGYGVPQLGDGRS